MSETPTRPTGLVSKATDIADVRAFKMVDGDAGGFSGYANPFGQLDSAGDITMPGAFADAIAGFLAHGFVPDNHEWSKRLGYPVGAHEDDYGLFIDVRFHSTPRAQDARTEAAERFAAGLSERLSIGFTLAEWEYVKGADAVEHLINPTADQIAECAAMTRVRLIHKVKQLFEVSLVSVPAAAGSDVVDVKSVDGVEAESKGALLGGNIEESLSIRAVEMLHERLMWRVMYDLLYDAGETPVDTRLDILDDAFDELKDESMRIIRALLTSAPDVIDEAKADLAALVESKSATNDAPPAERRLADHSDAVLAAVAELSTRYHAVRDLRTKAGRRFSRATEDRIKTNAAALRERADDLDQMLAEGMPDDAGDGFVMLAQSPTDTTPGADTATDATATTEYVDAEIANGLYAALITEHGIQS